MSSCFRGIWAGEVKIRSIICSVDAIGIEILTLNHNLSTLIQQKHATGRRQYRPKEKRDEKKINEEKIIEPEKPWQAAFSIISMNLLSYAFLLSIIVNRKSIDKHFTLKYALDIARVTRFCSSRRNRFIPLKRMCNKKNSKNFHAYLYY